MAEDPRVVRARTHVVRALMVAESGRPAEAERRLRDALGVLERRHRYAAAARAAATLGYLLRERGDVSRAESTLARARVLVDVAAPAGRASRSPVFDETHAEKEDYVQAKALLTMTGSSGPRSGEQLDLMVSAAAELCTALVVDGGPLDAACACLQRLVNARGVAVLFLGAGNVYLGSAGIVSRRLVDTALSSEAGVNETTVVPIRNGKRQDTRLLVNWGRRLEGVESSIASAVVRLAAELCTPEVEWAMRRPRVSTGHVEMATGLIGRSVEMDGLRNAIEDAAACSYPILIQGETGTGKELVARALHRSSPRRNGALCAVNCAALTDDLFEAELFGYARGAFTGAVVQRPGLFEEAHRGTLFLDEVGELSQRAQAKLLRAVQEGEVRRLGENGIRQVDVRLVAATNRSLSDDAAVGRFRQDLLFRLAVIQIHTPPLRRRRGDIEVLARHFWDQAQARVGSHAVLGTAVLERLVGYDWPGNVRELENVIARLSVRAPRRGTVPVQALPREIRTGSFDGGKTLAQARDDAERECVRTALARALGRPGVAAEALGISRQGLAKLMTRLGLTRDGSPPPKL